MINTEKRGYFAKNVEKTVIRAISQFCKDNGITHAEYLKKDRRISKLLLSNDETNPWHKKNGYISK